MANTTDRNLLYQWFSTGKKPTEAQFKAWIDSFYHLSDLLSPANIDGLQGMINDLGDLIATKAPAQNGDGYLVVYTLDGVIPAGLNGLSAYQLAVEEGYIGTLPEWLASLAGADGDARKLLKIYATEAELPPVADMQEGLLYATVEL